MLSGGDRPRWAKPPAHTKGLSLQIFSSTALDGGLDPIVRGPTTDLAFNREPNMWISLNPSSRLARSQTSKAGYAPRAKVDYQPLPWAKNPLNQLVRDAKISMATSSSPMREIAKFRLPNHEIVGRPPRARRILTEVRSRKSCNRPPRVIPHSTRQWFGCLTVSPEKASYDLGFTVARNLLKTYLTRGPSGGGAPSPSIGYDGHAGRLAMKSAGSKWSARESRMSTFMGRRPARPLQNSRWHIIDADGQITRGALGHAHGRALPPGQNTNQRIRPSSTTGDFRRRHQTAAQG